MRRQWHGFSSPLASAFEQFLGYKRALGRRFRVEESVLRLFDRFLIVQSLPQLDLITPQVVDAFLASRPRLRPRSYNHLRGALVRFFEWSVAQGHVSSSPVQAPPRRVTGQRGQTYYTIFAVLYGLGLRVGEVSRLTIADVDLDRRLLVIRETKFGKTRLVPFGPVSPACSRPTVRPQKLVEGRSRRTGRSSRSPAAARFIPARSRRRFTISCHASSW